ncbi:hypothetical protein WME91_03080 [Sorangium sp. So ce269]
MMPFEKPQKGNPHQLTVKQHVHTAHAISQFEGTDGCVDVKLLSSGKTIRVACGNAVFCANRVWDERAEKGYMQAVEHAFHAELARAEIAGRAARNHAAISRYHLLWGLRHFYTKNSISDITLTDVSGSGLSKEQEEILEAKWGGFVRSGGVSPARFNISLKIQQRLDMHMSAYAGREWGLLRAAAGQFLVADCYGELAVLPISPTLCFCGDAPDRAIEQGEVAAINRASMDAATAFYFGRDLAACPV